MDISHNVRTLNEENRQLHICKEYAGYTKSHWNKMVCKM